MASIDGVVFEGIDCCPYASVRLLTPSGHVVAEQTASASGEFRFVVPSGLWGIEAEAGEQRIAVRDVMAFDGERFPVYVCIDSGERRFFPRRRGKAPEAEPVEEPAAPAATSRVVPFPSAAERA